MLRFDRLEAFGGIRQRGGEQSQNSRSTREGKGRKGRAHLVERGQGRIESSCVKNTQPTTIRVDPR